MQVLKAERTVNQIIPQNLTTMGLSGSVSFLPRILWTPEFPTPAQCGSRIWVVSWTWAAGTDIFSWKLSKQCGPHSLRTVKVMTSGLDFIQPCGANDSSLSLNFRAEWLGVSGHLQWNCQARKFCKDDVVSLELWWNNSASASAVVNR